ncbi:MAG: type VI secretion system tube protein Hcp [Betaproteobacteria bacterium]|nr:type VI secretion system tube protein Hcp [Betaproteobacteria bacterium]
MAQDIFLKLEGVNGESQDADHKDEIELLSWSWGMHQSGAMHSGSGGGAGKADVSDFEFHHRLDRASPNLMRMCLTGKHIAKACLTVRKSGGQALDYLKLTMEDVLVTRVEPSMSGSDAAQGNERVCLSFARVTQEYKVQNAQGGSGGAVSAGYDLKRNQEA